MESWENLQFEKNGWFFPFLYLAPPWFFGCALFLFYLFFLEGWEIWEKAIFLFFGLYWVYRTYWTVRLLIVLRRSVQKITREDSGFRIRTFGNKQYLIVRIAELIEDNSFFKRYRHKILFPPAGTNLVVRSNEGEFYVLGETKGIEELKQALILHSDSYKLNQYF